MRRVLIVLGALAVFGAVRAYTQRPHGHSAGQLVAAAPAQTGPSSPGVVEHGRYRLTPRADFSIEARVLSRADYRFDDGADLAPVDLALGWGRMSDSAVIDQLGITQSARFYSYRWSDAPPIPPDEIVRSSANMHLIPADAEVERDLARVRVGSLVHLRGRLVDATRATGWRWNTSLTREDSGAGACELVLVDALEVR